MERTIWDHVTENTIRYGRRGHGNRRDPTHAAEGPFVRSELRVASFATIEADSLDEAVALVSKTPGPFAEGVVEVWPLETA